MTVAFYKVVNSKGYERHTFDNLYDSPQVIKEMLSELRDDEFRVYDMDNSIDRSIFQEEYNDADLDGGWWCICF